MLLLEQETKVLEAEIIEEGEDLVSEPFHRLIESEQLYAHRFEGFWSLLREALVPGGRVFFVDSGATSGSSGQERTDTTETRELNDGRKFEIVKHYYEPGALRARLAGLGWEFEIGRTAEFFIHGAGGWGAGGPTG